MAINISSTSSLADILQNVYGNLNDTFAEEHTMWNLVPTAPEGPSAGAGAAFIVGVRVSYPGGWGFRQETAKLPDPAASRYDQASYTPQSCYATVQLTGLAIDKGKVNEGVFKNTIESEVNGAYNRVLGVMNRVSYGDGSGYLATLSAQATLSTSATWNATCNNDRGVQLIKPGDLIDFYASNGAVDESAIANLVYDVDIPNKVVVFSANDSSYVANHPQTGFSAYTIAEDAIPTASVLVAAGARDAAYAASDTRYEMYGLDAIFDDGTLLDTFAGINADTHKFWRANILGNNGTNRPLTEQLFIDAAHLHRQQTNNMPTRAVMGQGMETNCYNLWAGDVRFLPRELKGGWDTMSMSVGGKIIDFVIDPDCPPNKIYFMENDSVEKFMLRDLSFDEEMFHVSGYDQKQWILALRGNMGTRNRKKCTLLKDIDEPS